MELAPATVDRLIEAARRARANAWAPYSGFAVGAALLVADGRIFAGCNVENASYGLAVCAERHAVAAAVAAGVRAFTALAVVGGAGAPVPPCGACRQVLAEFGVDLPILLSEPGGAVERVELAALLPRPFGPADLGAE